MSQIEYNRDPKTLIENKWSRSLFPKLEGKAYELLKHDIKENGIGIPLSITKKGLVLRGNERLRVALELGLSQVPVTIFPSDNEVEQKIWAIIDNLARKSVDFETKFKCFQLLKKLYGLKQRENIPKKGQKGFQEASNVRSSDRPLKSMSEPELDEALKGLDAKLFSGKWKSLSFEEKRKVYQEKTEELEVEQEVPIMTEEEIAKETGISRSTFERAQKIQRSKEIPEKVKEAIFKGDIAVRPVVELLKKPKEVREEVLERIEKQLTTKKTKVQVSSVTREVEEEKEPVICGIPPAPPIEDNGTTTIAEIKYSTTYPKCCPRCPFYKNCKGGAK